MRWFNKKDQTTGINILFKCSCCDAMFFDSPQDVEKHESMMRFKLRSRIERSCDESWEKNGERE